MLSNYDAKAVAKAMGIGFVQSPKTVPLPAGTPTDVSKAGSKSLRRAVEGKFVLKIGDATVLMVDTKADTKPVPFNAPEVSVSQFFADLENNLVSSPSPLLIEKAVEAGLPRKVLRHVAELLSGGDKAKVSSLEWDVVPKTTLERREHQLSPQESERTERVARLFVHARRVLGTEKEAREFMAAPHPQLDGRSPIDASRTDLSTRRTEQILHALEYGLAP